MHYKSIHSWDISEILAPGHSANTYDLETNCYFCTAAALQGKNSHQLVIDSDLMQYNTGTAEDFCELFDQNIGYEKFTCLEELMEFLSNYLPKSHAVALGYDRDDGTGHMVVVVKMAVFLDSLGDAGYPDVGYLKHIDYQTENPQLVDGVLPLYECISRITNYYVFYG